MNKDKLFGNKPHLHCCEVCGIAIKKGEKARVHKQCQAMLDNKPVPWASSKLTSELDMRSRRVISNLRRKLNEGVVHWNRDMGLEELREKFPDIYMKMQEEAK